MTHKTTFILILSSLVFASLACQTVVPGSATPTFDDPAASVLEIANATATAEAANAPARATQAAATVAERATQQAQADATQNAQATASAFEDIAPDLEMLGLTAENGRLAYRMTDPIYIPADLPNFYFYDPLLYPSNPVFRDFVLGVDVEWDSRTGVAGCGIIVRSEDDLDMGEQIHFRTLRLSGLPAWVVWQLKYNEIKGVLTGDVKVNSAINQGANSSNHYVLKVLGTTMTVYANGTKLGSATMTVNRTEGQVAFYTWQESGESECIFSNAWVFELPPYSDAAPADQEGDPSS